MNLKPYPPVHYNEVKFVRYPAVVIPALPGLRVVAVWNEEECNASLINGDKEYSFPHINGQLSRFFGLYPRLIFDGVISCKGKTIEQIKVLLEEKSCLLKYYVIDCIPKGLEIKSSTRVDMYRRILDHFVEHDGGSKVYDSIQMLRTFTVSIDTHMKEYNNRLVDDGYSGSFIRVGCQGSPFAEPNNENKYHLIKTTGKI